ncbi:MULTISPECIES: helix-turn-helix domain-containing protein [Bacillus cereus group]|uniref:helix-turn-helix domain-containing protein n=1 Tax=Bacillus cereus group TaxID=86661 RepID=UPI00187AFD2D|nr:helix-turn-helix transcriptional regulator [Bacillus mycoides]MBE7129597.1 helix-turn-helix transcriptional regulator [Bacillus mycoides]MEC2943469.1 helix-turn-helix transcriptional regulator [Bacillus cereus]MEC3174627.1 helix-turn-helix transcriptional regulator [Bacillus cereus]
MEQKELKIEIMLNPKTIGILRRIKGVTAVQLADRMFVSHSVVKKAECGQVPISDIMNVRLWKALAGLGYSVEDIYVINMFVEHKGGGVLETA